MNAVRITATLVLIAIAGFALARSRSPFNASTVAAVPFATELSIQEVFFREVPFGGRAALVVVAANICILAGGLCAGEVGAHPSAHLVTRPRRRNVGLVSAYGISALSLTLALIAGRAVSGSAAGDVGQGVFDRELAVAHLSSLDQLLYRMSVLTFLTAVGYSIILWRAGGRRFLPPAIGALGSSVVFAVGARGRLPTLIAFALATLCVALVNPKHDRSMRPSVLIRLIVMALVVLLASNALFGQVAEDRYGGVQQQYAFLYHVSTGPSALSVWLDHTQHVELRDTDTFGIAVAGWLDLIGQRPRSLGQASPVYLLREGDSTTSTNVYTGYFFLIQDVGIPGLLTVMLLVGFMASRLERRFNRRPTSALLVTRVCLLLLLGLMPNMLLTYYNFWWFLLIGGVVVAPQLVIYRGTSVPARTSGSVRPGA